MVPILGIGRLEAAVDAPSRRRTEENQFAHVIRHPPQEPAIIAEAGIDDGTPFPTAPVSRGNGRFARGHPLPIISHFWD